MLRKRLFELGLLVALLAGLLVGLPVQAQSDPPPDDGEGDPVTVEITGEVAPDSATGEISVGEGGITVGGVKIAPAGAFQPSDYKLGDCVTVTGVLLNSDVLQAVEIVPSEDCVEEEVPVDDTGEQAQEQVQEQDQEQEMDGCTNGSHPVLQAYAEEFGVAYEDLEAWHCNNMGLGEIGRALLMAEALDGVSYDEILQKRADGESWGAIKKFYDVKGGDLAPGRVISGHHENQGTPSQEGESVGPGNSENAPGQSGDNPGHGGNPPGQEKEKDKNKDKENPGQGGGKKK
jgi:hypothetical protein